MIEKWKILPISTEELKNQFIIYVQGNKEEIIEIVNNFNSVCREPFIVNQDEFNWAFYVVDSTGEQRLKIEEVLRKKENETYQQGTQEETIDEDSLKSIVEAVKRVVQDLDKKGLTIKELKSIEEKASVEERVQKAEVIKEKQEEISNETVKEIKINENKGITKYRIDETGEIKIGYLFPLKDKQKFDIFINTLFDVGQVTSKDPIELKKIFADSYNPFDINFNLNSIINIFKNNEIELLIILTPDSRMMIKEKDIIEELKRKLKKKVLFKIVPVTKMEKRSIYLSIIVDIALFREKGLEYFLTNC